MEEQNHSLSNGETLRVVILSAGAGLPQPKVEAVHDLILQPRALWFSAAERRHLDGALRGTHAEVARDCFFVGWIGDEPVGSAYYGTAASTPEIGLLAYVITEAAHRGRGICTILTRAAVSHFVDAGGVCLHLGTSNPIARNIYEGCGFRDYNGHVMRYLGPNESGDSFDAAYFAWAGAARVRRGHWGDLARVGMLYVAPHRWLIKDYPQRIYSHPAILHQRCGSILPSMMVNATGGKGGLWVLENPAGRIVGTATATRLDNEAQGHAPVLDFLTAPSYVDQAANLLLAATKAQSAAGAEQVRVFIASCDDEKAGLARDVGFQHEATLAGQIQAGTDRHDLDIYVCPG